MGKKVGCCDFVSFGAYFENFGIFNVNFPEAMVCAKFTP
jgi:hypothetical protein